MTQGKERRYQQAGTDQAANKPVAHPQQQRRQHRPGKLALHLQGVLGGQPQADADDQAVTRKVSSQDAGPLARGASA